MSRTANEIIIVGGGASGMMAAICAARAGAEVTILERNPRLGKKLSQTGNGRCNYTNLEFRQECFRGADPEFTWTLANKLKPQSTIDFFMELGIYPKKRGSYVYPGSDQASSFVNVMKSELEKLGVRVIYECLVKEITTVKAGFLLNSSKGSFSCKALIIATGSCAFLKGGSEGSGYELAKALGHSIVPVVPSLTGLICRGKQYKEMSGVRTDAELRLMIDGRQSYIERGELQLADYGLSGIPVFQLSSIAAYALRDGKEVEVLLNFMPELSEGRLHKYLLERRAQLKRASGDFLEGLLNQKLASVLIKAAGIDKASEVSCISDSQIDKLSTLIHSYRAEVIESRAFEFAQCASGGVNTNELCPESLESRLVPGLYFAGELIDIDGICGGYNLQLAWASGWLVGAAAAGRILG